MDIKKETLLNAEDSKTRDAILYDIMSEISDKIDGYQKDIFALKGVGATLAVLFSGIGAWLGLK